MSYVLGIQLAHFRTYAGYTLKLNQSLTVIIGPNASGKTTLIEVLFLLATGESFRAGKIEEMIQLGAEISRVQAVVKDATQEEIKIEMTLTRGEVQGKRVAKRLYAVNQVKRRKRDAVGRFRVVVFRPEDLRLIEGSPSRRRGFLNQALSMVFPEYALALETYEKTLVRLNKFLQAVRERQQPESVLSYWNTQLAQSGEIITQYRTMFIKHIANHVIDLPYVFGIEYLSSTVSLKKLTEYQDRAILAGHVLVGPHKDDIRITIGEKIAVSSGVNYDNAYSTPHAMHDVASYGSRGQQRLAVLWLKICELAFVEQHTRARPLLLLDDIFSELDENNAGLITHLLAEYQTVLTSTTPQVLDILPHLPLTVVYTLAEDGEKKPQTALDSP